MPFGFTGELPAPPATGTPFTSFASFASSAPPASPATPASSAPHIASFGAAPSFGSRSSPWTASASPAPVLTQQSWPSAKTEKHDEAVTLMSTEKTFLEQAPTDDALSQALRRSIMAKPAIFGTANVAADAFLDDFTAAHARDGKMSKAEVTAQLSKELRAAFRGNPLAEAFVREGFAKATSAALSPHVSTSRERSQVQDDEAEVSDPYAPESHKTTAPPNENLPSTYTFSAGSKMYHGILDDAFESRVLSSVVQCPEAQYRLCEILVAQMGRGLTQQALEDELDFHLRVVKIDMSLEDQDSFISYLFHLADCSKLRKKLKEEAPALSEGKEAMSPAEVSENGGDTDPPATDGDGTGDEIAESPSFRFMDLPPELRVWVYRELLAPGTISLEYIYGNNRDRVSVRPRLTLSILRACRLIHHEAKNILYDENTICLDLDLSANYPNRPIINKPLLSADTLARLTSVQLTAEIVHCIYKDVTNCNWFQLQGLTAVKDARISIIQCKDYVDPESKYRTNLLKEVVERLPANCTIEFGARKGAEEEHVQNLATEITLSRQARHYKITAVAVEKEVLACAAQGIPAGVQGSKSGSTRNFRWPAREALQLAPLVKEEEIDEGIVLGR